MAQRRYRAAVVGLGFMGAGDQVSGDAIGQRVENLRGTHAQSLARHPRVQLACGSSRDRGRRERFTAATGVARTYERWQEMLASERLDIVTVATNSPHHAEVTIACARAGVRCVFCEKPLATSLRDADEMIRACAEHGTLLVVNHTRRWDPTFAQAARLLRDGAIGTVHHALVRWPAGRLGNVGTHVFDALDILLAREARAVIGRLDDTGRPDCRGPRFHDPGGWGIVLYDGGVKAFVDASESIEAPVPLSFRVAGGAGELGIDGFRAWLRRWGKDPEPLAAPAGGEDAVYLAVDEIVRCLDSGGTPASSGEAARKALEIVIAFHACARRGAREEAREVALPLTGDDRLIDVPIG